MKSTVLAPCLALAAIAGISAGSPARGNSIAWEPSRSLIDAVDLSSLGPFYWFANFNNPGPVVNASADAFEARKLPSWLRLETREAFLGKDDSGAVADTTIATGYSFVENSSGTSGGKTVGGQPDFNVLTLPGGVSGISGQVLEVQQGLNSTSSQAFLRVLAGAPDAIRLWVVTDNGRGPQFSSQRRIRVILRDSTGAPNFDEISGTRVEAEALPNGKRLVESGSLPQANNGIADAWAFSLSGIRETDLITIRPTGGAGFGEYAGFAGILVQPIPEPTASGLAASAAAAATLLRRRRRSRRAGGEQPTAA
jgi:hypothetical protein